MGKAHTVVSFRNASIFTTHSQGSSPDILSLSGTKLTVSPQHQLPCTYGDFFPSRLPRLAFKVVEVPGPPVVLEVSSCHPSDLQVRQGLSLAHMHLGLFGLSSRAVCCAPACTGDSWVFCQLTAADGGTAYPVDRVSIWVTIRAVQGNEDARSLEVMSEFERNDSLLRALSLHPVCMRGSPDLRIEI